MNSPKQKHENLERILRQAYRKKEKLQVGDQWQARVIRRVQELGGIQSTPGFPDIFAQFAWRLAPYVCLLIFALTAFLMSDLTSGDEAYQFLTNGTEEITLTQIF